MAKKQKRRLAFRTEHQRNPLSHARLTEYDASNGVICIIELDGKVRELSLRYSDVLFAMGFSFAHRRMDERQQVAQPGWDGTPRLPFAVETFRNFEHFQAFLRREKEVPGTYFHNHRTDEGDLVTENHERLIELLAYANLPVWAKDKTTFLKRWGRTAVDHTFEAMFPPTARHEQVVKFENIKRRAA